MTSRPGPKPAARSLARRRTGPCWLVRRRCFPAPPERCGAPSAAGEPSPAGPRGRHVARSFSFLFVFWVRVGRGTWSGGRRPGAVNLGGCCSLPSSSAGAKCGWGPPLLCVRPNCRFASRCVLALAAMECALTVVLSSPDCTYTHAARASAILSRGYNCGCLE